MFTVDSPFNIDDLSIGKSPSISISCIDLSTVFLIFALGNDIQLALAAIFNVIIFKRCVKLCEY